MRYYNNSDPPVCEIMGKICTLWKCKTFLSTPLSSFNTPSHARLVTSRIFYCVNFLIFLEKYVCKSSSFSCTCTILINSILLQTVHCTVNVECANALYAKERLSRKLFKDDKLTLEEFREGSKQDPRIVQALSLEPAPM